MDDAVAVQRNVLVVDWAGRLPIRRPAEIAKGPSSAEMAASMGLPPNPIVSSGLGRYFQELFSRDFWGLELYSGGWTHKSFRPITTVSYRLGFLLHGIDGIGFHVENVLLHILCALAVFWFSFLVLRKARVINGAEKFPDFFWPAVSALLFLLHPVHVENIAYLVGRADILSTIFGLIGISLYVRSNQSRKPGNFFASLIQVASLSFWLILSGLSKETGFMLFGVACGVEGLGLLTRLNAIDLQYDAVPLSNGSRQLPEATSVLPPSVSPSTVASEAENDESLPIAKKIQRVRFLGVRLGRLYSTILTDPIVTGSVLRIAFLVCSAVGILIARHSHTDGTEINMSVQDNHVQFETDRKIRWLS